MSQVTIRRKQIDGRRDGRAFWRWLRGRLSLTGGDTGESGHRGVPPVVAPPLVPAPGRIAPGGLGSAVLPRDESVPATGGVVLPFPIHGEALLVRLAEVLRRRVEHSGPARDPLLLQIARGPRTQLSIDRMAYVEFIPEYAEYHAVLEAQRGTRVILETADFDVLVDFLVPYVATRLAESGELEAAS